MQHLTHKSCIRQNQHWESFNVASLIYLQDWQQMGPKSAEKSVQGFEAVSVCRYSLSALKCLKPSWSCHRELAVLTQGSSGWLYRDPNKDSSSAFTVDEIVFSLASQPRKKWCKHGAHGFRAVSVAQEKETQLQSWARGAKYQICHQCSKQEAHKMITGFCFADGQSRMILVINGLERGS